MSDNLRPGDVVLIEKGGYGFVRDDVGKCVELIGRKAEGEYHEEYEWYIKPYSDDLATLGHEEDGVGVQSFGKNPCVLFNTKEETVRVAEGSKKEVDTILGIDRATPLVNTTDQKSALDVQVGGGHYKDKAIQPIQYIFANNLGFCEGNIVKYTTRWRDKNGIQDLEKVIHYAQLLIEQAKKEGF